MRHERDKKRFDLADDSQWGNNRESAVDLLVSEIARQFVDRPQATWITLRLPRDVWRMAALAAADGMHKGHGRRRPPTSRGDKVRIFAIVIWARDRKAELIASGTMKAIEAEHQAAKEASDQLLKLYRIIREVSTIKRLMQSDR
jgi:hypothetical protein